MVQFVARVSLNRFTWLRDASSAVLIESFGRSPRFCYRCLGMKIVKFEGVLNVHFNVHYFAKSCFLTSLWLHPSQGAQKTFYFHGKVCTMPRENGASTSYYPLPSVGCSPIFVSRDVGPIWRSEASKARTSWILHVHPSSKHGSELCEMNPVFWRRSAQYSWRVFGRFHGQCHTADYFTARTPRPLFCEFNYLIHLATNKRGFFQQLPSIGGSVWRLSVGWRVSRNENVYSAWGYSTGSLIAYSTKNGFQSPTQIPSKGVISLNETL